MEDLKAKAGLTKKCFIIMALFLRVCKSYICLNVKKKLQGSWETLHLINTKCPVRTLTNVLVLPLFYMSFLSVVVYLYVKLYLACFVQSQSVLSYGTVKCCVVVVIVLLCGTNNFSGRWTRDWISWKPCVIVIDTQWIIKCYFIAKYLK